MNKLPVGETIRFAYAFTFGEIGTVIGLIWIPTLINALIGFFGLRSIYQTMVEMIETGQPPVGGSFALWMMLLIVGSVLLLAMISVAVIRQSLGLRKGPAYAHFSLGAEELRVFGGFFGLYLLLFLFLLIYLAVTSGVVAAMAAGGAAAAPIAGLVASLVSLGGLCAVIYLGVRLSFLMVPAALSGNTFGLTQSWHLTKGNFWRIFAVGLATLLPLIFVMGIAQTAIMGPEYFVPPDPAQAKDTAANMKVLATQMRATLSHLPLLIGLGFVISPVLYGLLFAPAAFAFKALSGRTVVEPTE